MKTQPAYDNLPKIEKGVPIPIARGGWGSGKPFIQQLVVNDSFVTRRAKYHGYVVIAKRLGMKLLCRAIAPGSDDIRVWRIK